MARESMCRECGNKECAADGCTLWAIRIMLECGEAGKCFQPLRKIDHFQSRKEGDKDA